MKRAESVVFSLALMVAAASQAVAQTIDSYTTPQSLAVETGKSNTSVVNAPEALGGKRRATIYYSSGAGTLSLSIGNKQAGYKLVGSGLQGGRIGWLWYVDSSTPIKPVDLTDGGKYNAFQIDVLEVTTPTVVQIDALDANQKFDSVMIYATKTGQSLIYDFSAFIAPESPTKIDFTKIIGLQMEFDIHDAKTGSVKLTPIKMIKKPASPGPEKPQ